MIQNEQIVSTVRRQDSNAINPEYISFQQRLTARVAKAVSNGSPLFQTNAEGLWKAYLNAFPTPEERQHANCRACQTMETKS